MTWLAPYYYRFWTSTLLPLRFDLIWLASYCMTTQTRTLTLASYCCPTDLAPLLPYESNKSPCRYAYGPTRLVLIYLRTLITRRADTPMTWTRLGRASLPRYTNTLAPYCHLHEPVACIVLLPKPISSVPICLRNPNLLLAPYCHQ